MGDYKQRAYCYAEQHGILEYTVSGKKRHTMLIILLINQNREKHIRLWLILTL